MSNPRESLITEAAQALFEYITEISSATHGGKRPGLTWNRPENIEVASCGAFREWSIFAVHDRFAIEADGYRVRDNQYSSTRLFVHAGEGTIQFPPNDSRSHHSLSLRLRDIPPGYTGRLIDVTKEEGPWDKLLPEITNRLNAATLSLKRSVAEYDSSESRQKEASRRLDLEAAVSVFK